MRPGLRHAPFAASALVLGCYPFSLLASASFESRAVSAGMHDACAFWVRYSPEIQDRRASAPIPLLAFSRGGAAPTGGPINARPTWPLWLKSSTGSLYFILPLWIPADVAALPLAAAGARYGRALYRSRYTHLCPRCGYDLSATPGTPCPECGRGASE